MLDFYTGSVVTRDSGCMDVYAFYRKAVDTVEQPVHLAVKDPKSEIASDGHGIINTTPSGVAKTDKVWVRRRMKFPGGSFVKFVVRCSGGGDPFGSIGAFIIQPRDTAPLQEISIQLPTDRYSSMSMLYVTGRFDLLSPEAVHEFGLDHPKENMGASFDLETLAEYMSIRVLEAAIAPKAKASTRKLKGTTKAVLRARPGRRLKFN